MSSLGTCGRKGLRMGDVRCDKATLLRRGNTMCLATLLRRRDVFCIISRKLGFPAPPSRVRWRPCLLRLHLKPCIRNLPLLVVRPPLMARHAGPDSCQICMICLEVDSTSVAMDSTSHRTLRVTHSRVDRHGTDSCQICVIYHNFWTDDFLTSGLGWLEAMVIGSALVVLSRLCEGKVQTLI